jgi:hypothetical protein
MLLAVGLLASLSALARASTLAAAPATGSSSAAPTVRLAYVTETASSPPAVWVAEGSGREPMRLGPGSQPLIAPNGQSVAAALFGATANSEQGPALAVYSTVGGPTVDLLNLASATATALAWSPDSRYLALSLQSTSVTSPALSSGLAVFDTSTGTVTTIAHGQIYGASFAPGAGGTLVYARAPSQSLSAPVNLYVSQPDGAGVRALTRDGHSLNPVWGPRYIAYDRERLRRNDAPVYQIWLASSTRAALRRVTNIPVASLVSGLVPLSFSGDGGRLLAEFEGQDTSEAWTVRVSSASAHRLSVRRRSVMAAGLSRDGRTVLIDEGSFEEPASNGRVASIPFAGGSSTVLVAHGAEASWNG